MRFGMSRIVLQASRETTKRFRGVSLLRLDDAQIAIGVGDAVLVFNRLGVELRSFLVAAFIQHQRLLKRAKLWNKAQNLRGGLGEEMQLVRIFSGSRALLDARVTELRSLSREF